MVSTVLLDFFFHGTDLPCPLGVREELTLLRQKQSVSLLQCNAMSGVLVIWREARRVCRLGDLARDDLLEGIDTLASAVDGVHEMHDGGFCE